MVAVGPNSCEVPPKVLGADLGVASKASEVAGKWPGGGREVAGNMAVMTKKRSKIEFGVARKWPGSGREVAGKWPL